MPTPDQINAVVAGWVEKAEHDFQTACHILKLGRKGPSVIVCFMPSSASRNTLRPCSC